MFSLCVCPGGFCSSLEQAVKSAGFGLWWLKLVPMNVATVMHARGAVTAETVWGFNGSLAQSGLLACN